MICNVYFSFHQTQNEFKKLYCTSEILIENTSNKIIWQNMFFVKSELLKITLFSDFSKLKDKNILKMNYFVFKL